LYRFDFLVINEIFYKYFLREYSISIICAYIHLIKIVYIYIYISSNIIIFLALKSPGKYTLTGNYHIYDLV